MKMDKEILKMVFRFPSYLKDAAQSTKPLALLVAFVWKDKGGTYKKRDN